MELPGQHRSVTTADSTTRPVPRRGGAHADGEPTLLSTRSDRASHLGSARRSSSTGGGTRTAVPHHKRFKRDEEDDPSSSSSSTDEDVDTPEIPPAVDDETIPLESAVDVGAEGKTAGCALWVLARLSDAMERMTKKPKHHKECLEDSSFYVFSPDNPFRLFVYNLVHHAVFESLIILIIFGNCVVLAMDDPTTDTQPSWQDATDILFVTSFSAEMVLKLIALGAFMHDGSYFRSGWNCLDFLIVILSLLQFTPGFGNFSAFRTVRVLRPLRSMNAIPQLKMMAICLAHSVRGLANVLALAGFIYIVFSILATQLWMGNMVYRCAYLDGTVVRSMMCTNSAGGSIVGAYCPDYMQCVQYGNPNNGNSSFDSVLYSLLVVFQTITLESWSVLMYLAMDSCGWPAAIYFVLVVIICGYFVLNLCLAVISFHFQDVKEKLAEKEMEAAKQHELELRQTEAGMQRARVSLRLQAGTGVEALLSRDTLNTMGVRDVHRVLDPTDAKTMDLADRYLLLTQLSQTAAGQLILVVNEDDVLPSQDELAATSPDVEAKFRTFMSRRISSPFMRNLYRYRATMFEFTEGNLFAAHREAQRKIEVAELQTLLRGDDAFALNAAGVQVPLTWFNRTIYVIIVINTILLAAQHFQQSDLQTQIMTTMNAIFTALFTLEMIVKLFALSPWFYVLDPFNVFDGAVTIVSLVEVSLGTHSTFSVFRAFRMLRLIRVLQGIPSLRQVIEVFVIALGDCGYLLVLMALYFLISALLGMQFFSNQLQVNGLADDPVTSTFQTFLQAIYVMMQILTFDSWPDIMWNSINATSQAAIAFYVCCICVGNFILMNLLIAILIDSFQDYSQKHSKVRKHVGGGANSDSDEDGDVVIKRGLAVTILAAEPEVQLTSLLPKGAKDFLKQELGTVAQAQQQQPLPPSSSIKVAEGTVAFAPPNGASHENGESESEEMSEVISRAWSTNEKICDLCGDYIVEPYPSMSKSIVPPTAEEFHDRICERIQFRKVKERVIRHLLESMVSVDSESDDSDTEKALHLATAPMPPKNTNPFAVDLSPSGQDVDHLAESVDVEEPQVFSHLFGKKSAVTSQRKVNARFPTVEAIEDAFGKAWEVGLLLGENSDDYAHGKSWAPIKKLLKRESALLELKIGEEQIGRALTAYTRANVPHQILTNGGYSLFLFGPRNALRVNITMLLQWPPFDYIILAVICASSVVMACENPRNSAEVASILTNIGNAFTLVFVIEMVLKWIGYGFYFIEGAYLRDPWNWLDFVVVIVSVLSFVLQTASAGSGVNAFKVLRTMRVLRPLRLINRNRGLRMVVVTLIQSIKGIANMTLILFLVFIIFAILGVQLFSGTQYSCTDPSITNRTECVGNFTRTVQVEGLTLWNLTHPNGSWTMTNITTLVDQNVTSIRLWENADFHFDDTLNAFILLAHVATLDNWGNQMYSVINGVDYDTAPQSWYSPLKGLYFVAFILIGALFMLNMFIAIIIDNFETAKADLDGVSLLTDDQKLWVDTQRMMLNFRPQALKIAGKFKIQQAAAHLVEETLFELTSAAVVLLNIVAIALEHQDQSQVWTTTLKDLNVLFTILFAVEAVCKIVAYGFRYFNEGWNRFDFFIVVLGIVDIATDGNRIPINVGLIRILRVFRIARILAVIRKARDIRVLLETLWYSIPSLANIGMFIFLVIFMFTVLGVQLWSNVNQDGIGLTNHMNFENFGNAFLFLIQLTTLDNWGATMNSLEVNVGCTAAETPDGVDHCGSAWAPLYFFPFILISGYVTVNLFIAIILDNFNTTMELDRSDLKVADLKKFADAWALFDPDATMLTKTRNFPNLLAALKPPLGIERKTDRHMLLKIAREYVIPEHEGEIHFVETLIPLARKVVGVTFSDEEIREHEELWKTVFPDLNELRVVRYRQKRVTVDQYFAATYIAGAFRRRLCRRIVQQMRKDLRDDMLSYYEDHDVDESQWTAVHRMDREERARAKNIVENQRMIEELVARQKRELANGEDASSSDEVEEEEVEPAQLSSRRGSLRRSLLGSLVGSDNFRNAQDRKRRDSSKRLPPRRDASDKNLKKRRQSLGLSGFTQLWAQHAAEL